jgi:hypothetical protein
MNQISLPHWLRAAVRIKIEQGMRRQIIYIDNIILYKSDENVCAKEMTIAIARYLSWLQI